MVYRMAETDIASLKIFSHRLKDKSPNLTKIEVACQMQAANYFQKRPSGQNILVLKKILDLDLSSIATEVRVNFEPQFTSKIEKDEIYAMIAHPLIYQHPIYELVSINMATQTVDRALIIGLKVRKCSK